jgi:hypothetical protein
MHFRNLHLFSGILNWKMISKKWKMKEQCTGRNCPAGRPPLGCAACVGQGRAYVSGWNPPWPCGPGAARAWPYRWSMLRLGRANAAGSKAPGRLHHEREGGVVIPIWGGRASDTHHKGPTGAMVETAARCTPVGRAVAPA